MLAQRAIRTAVVFLMVGLAMAIYMGAAQDFRFKHVHAHVNLLGWGVLGFVGLLYRAYPKLQRSWLPHAHYWLHTIGLVVFMGGFALRVTTGEEALAPIAGGAASVGVATLLLAFNVFWRLPGRTKNQEPDAQRSAGSLSASGSNRAAT
jgi:hypothetical protein